jgi:hypothetical protein
MDTMTKTKSLENLKRLIITKNHVRKIEVFLSKQEVISVGFGGKPYVVLCYARMRSGFITKTEYRKFQLDNRQKLINIHTEFSFLTSVGYIERNDELGYPRFRITMDGQKALSEVSRRKMVKERKLLRTGKLKREDTCYVHERF